MSTLEHSTSPSADTGNAAEIASPRSRVWVEICLRNVRANYELISKNVAPLGIMAVLKANAYGLGVEPIARCLVDAGVAAIGVAEPKEALAIRDLDVPVQILGSLISDEIPSVVANGFIAPITDLATAELLSAEAVRQGRTVTAHFKIDTGMGRLGIQLHEADEVIEAACALPSLQTSGIYSHFPHAYGDRAFTDGQISDFCDLLGRLEAKGMSFETVHIANSDGINNVPESYEHPFTMVRTGINLYGVFDLEGRQALALEPVLTLKTRLTAIREMPADATLGYGRLYRLPQPMTIGTVSIGYADGTPLGISNRGTVIIRGCHCPVLGRVSMDYTTVSLESVKDAEVGDDVTCLGDPITVKEWAAYKGTIPYDIICSIGNRVERVYLD